MTEEEFEAVALVLDQGWKGDFTETQEKAYFMMLSRFTVDEVVAALHLLAEEGSPFLPAVPEIVQAVRKLSQPSVPSWTEAWSLIERANGQRSRREALDVLAEHPIVLAFYEAEGGWDRLRLIEFYDFEHGGARQHLLGQRFDEYVDVAQARLAAGRALEVTGIRRGELDKPDVQALLDQQRDAGQLPAGDPASGVERPRGTAAGARATLEAWERGE